MPLALKVDWMRRAEQFWKRNRGQKEKRNCEIMQEEIEIETQLKEWEIRNYKEKT